MRFQVPQFIEVEDTIFGPLTLKQFIYLAGGSGLSFVIYTILPFYIALIFIIPVIGFSIALAFYKFNQRFPFIYLVEAAFKYMVSSKLYIWKKNDKKPVARADEVATLHRQLTVPKLSDSKLKDLTWNLDINERSYVTKKVL